MNRTELKQFITENYNAEADYLASGNTSPTASSIPMHLSPTMSFTPSKPRPRSHWKKLTPTGLVLFHALGSA